MTDVDMNNKKEVIYQYYHNMKWPEQESAWESFVTWKKNPLDNGAPAGDVPKLILDPLLNNPYFCPVSDKDAIIKIMSGALDCPVGRCFVMIRLSQNERPLVWVCGFGGFGSEDDHTRIIRVRIGVPIGTNKNYTVVFKNKETGEVEITYKSDNLHVIMAHLRVHYAPKCKIYKWFEI